MRRIVTVAAAVSVLLAATGCDDGASPRDLAPTPVPASSPTGSKVGSRAAFEDFAGLTIPASAGNVALRVTTGPTGEAAYRVTFNLPSAELDRFCRDGRLDRPLRVETVPDSYRTAFDYRGDSSTGVSVAEGSRPTDVDVQRQLLAVGTKRSVAEVRVYAYTMAR